MLICLETEPAGHQRLSQFPTAAGHAARSDADTELHSSSNANRLPLRFRASILQAVLALAIPDLTGILQAAVALLKRLGITNWSVA